MAIIGIARANKVVTTLMGAELGDTGGDTSLVVPLGDGEAPGELATTGGPALTPLGPGVGVFKELGVGVGLDDAGLRA